MDNTMIEGRLKAIEESLRLNKKVFNTTDLHRYTGLSKVLFISLPLLVKYLTTPLLEK